MLSIGDDHANVCSVNSYFLPLLYSQTYWPVYAHDPSGQRYSPLAQINTTNVAMLKLAWQYGIDRGGVDNNPVWSENLIHLNRQIMTARR